MRHISIREIEVRVERTTFQRGMEGADRGGVSDRVRSDDQVFGEVKGHRAGVRWAEPVRASCSCRAIRKAPFCEHATAVLVAWSRDPESFRAGIEDRTPRTKEKALQTQALEALERSLSELAESGLGTITDERIGPLRDLAARLRDCGLSRLSSPVTELAECLRREEGASLRKYVDRLVDLVFLERSIRAGRASVNRPAPESVVSTVDDLLRRYREWREDPSAPSDLPVLLRFAGCGARSGRLHLVDAAGALLPLDCEDIPLRKLAPVLTAPGTALLARVRFEEGSLVARPITDSTDSGHLRNP